jgi:hypothetical protein
MPPHGYVASSPQPHPYMWGVQHMMPPYGTPPHPYVTMYPPGGMYAHPSLPPVLLQFGCSVMLLKKVNVFVVSVNMFRAATGVLSI